NARFSAEEALYIINHSEAVAFFYHQSLDKIANQIRGAVPNVRHVISIGGEEKDVLSYDKLLEGASPQEPRVDIDPDDMMMIMYTSGATGTPKGVMTSHRNIMANTNTMTLELRIVPEEINLLVMPMYHNGGFWPTMTHFYRGATMILLPRFDAETVLEIVQRERVTFLNLVPTMLLRIVSLPNIKDYDLESLRLIMYAGAPIALEQLKKAMEVLGPHRFYTGLGCTEASGSMISIPTTEHALSGPLAGKLGSVGRDSMGVEIRIVDDAGNELPPGQIGEIIAKGDNVALGYWKMPEETAEIFRGGWVYTGDLGYRDEDAYIFIVDRKKDVIITGGENVSSSEVEQVIYQHPAVREAAVIGVPDKEWGEAVKAVVSLKPEYKDKVAAQEIVDFCRPRLAGFKRPKSVDLLDELPKNTVGKIAKQELKKQYRGRELSPNK
ncbi:MAG: AMP-binding protein, partial [Pseudomonadota bacterium]